jgi:hemerythrin superfamily protein
MDALTLLKEDHQKVKKILEELEKTTERGAKTRQELFGKLMAELTVHEKIEEEIFYPAVKERAETKKVEELIAESYEEHHFVDMVAAEIKQTPFEAEEWGAKFKVMKENIEHHAVEEEEGKLFPKVRRAFSADELEDLGTQMLELKEQTRSGIGQQQEQRAR